jgi:non-ribosomal peptide synthetase component E (peptide arylation enzyme)
MDCWAVVHSCVCSVMHVHVHVCMCMCMCACACACARACACACACACAFACGWRVQGKTAPLPARPPVPATVAVLCYTSGTTGNPKGAMLTHGNLAAIVAAVRAINVAFTPDDVHLSYLPLAHVFELVVETVCWFGGARVRGWAGDAGGGGVGLRVSTLRMPP